MPKNARPAARSKTSAKLASKPAAKLAPKIVEKSVKPAPIPAVAKAAAKAPEQGVRVHELARAERMQRDQREVLCRSCGLRPGRPTAIIGQLTATELCEVCANLRKERIRQNRAQQRGYRL